MYARVTVTTDERKDALVVPSNAVVDTGGRRGVFLAAENSMVAFRAVTVGVEEDTQIEIVDGVSEGDRVVTTGAAGLRDGDRVVLASSDGPSDGPVTRGARDDGGGRQGAGRQGGRRGGGRGQQGTP
jgi:hypothetical protein